MLPTFALKNANTLLESLLRKGMKYLPIKAGPIVFINKTFSTSLN
jgi:hypothetical protein